MTHPVVPNLAIRPSAIPLSPSLRIANMAANAAAAGQSLSNLEILRKYLANGGNKLLIVNRGRSRKGVSFSMSVFVVGIGSEIVCLDRILAPLLQSRMQRDEQVQGGLQYCTQSNNPAAELVRDLGRLLGSTPAYQLL